MKKKVTEQTDEREKNENKQEKDRMRLTKLLKRKISLIDLENAEKCVFYNVCFEGRRKKTHYNK